MRCRHRCDVSSKLFCSGPKQRRWVPLLVTRFGVVLFGFASFDKNFLLRSADIELMPALPYMSLLKCAGPKVNFIQADSAADVNARKYVNIMSGEFGIMMPVSAKVLTENRGKINRISFSVDLVINLVLSWDYPLALLISSNWIFCHLGIAIIWNISCNFNQRRWLDESLRLFIYFSFCVANCKLLTDLSDCWNVPASTPWLLCPF